MNTQYDIQNASSYQNLLPDTFFSNIASHILKDRNDHLTIRLVDEPEIQSLNAEFRDKNMPTNVLSFPFDMPSLPECNFTILGDIIICLTVVEKEAIQQHKDFKHHLAHMLVHGILHLLGYDHLEEHDAQIMEALEIKLLNELHIPNPYGDEY